METGQTQDFFADHIREHITGRSCHDCSGCPQPCRKLPAWLLAVPSGLVCVAVIVLLAGVVL